MDIRAVFFDIDGTFYDHITNQVLEETLSAIHQLKQNGYKVCLCSGRAIEMAEKLGVLQLFPWDGYVGGAGVQVYNENYDLLYESYFSEKQTEEIFRIGKENNICILSRGKHNFMTLPLNPYSQQMFKEFNDDIPEVRNWQHEKLVALSAFEKKGYDWSIFNHIEGINPQPSSDTCIDFLQSNINKVTGIHILMKEWGFPLHSYMAFGDSMNDIEMIKDANYGIVMGNGAEELKVAADKVIGYSNEPTIYQTLKDLHMI